MSSIPSPKIIRSLRQSVSLRISSSGELIINAPFYMPTPFIQKFLDEKEDWIVKALEKTQQKNSAKKYFTEGEKFLYLGKSYALKFAAITSIIIKEDLLFPKALLFRAEKELTAWYTKQAKEIITQRVLYHADKMKAEYKTIFFSDTKSKWGTCFPDNSLQFNWRLIMAPLMVIDYVVIHELAHTKEKNHSTDFWRVVRMYTPAYRQHRKWLDANGSLLILK